MSTTSVTTNRAQITVAEANACLLLGKAFGLTREFEENLPDLLMTVADDLEDELTPLARKVAERWAEALEDEPAATLAHTQLFLGPFEIQASPYAYTYLEPDSRLMGETSQFVANTYADAGLAPADGPSDAPDHIVTEWEFLYYLAYQSVETDDPKWSDCYHRFASEHMASWVPQLAAMIKTASNHPFYSALADFAEAFVTHEGRKCEIGLNN